MKKAGAVFAFAFIIHALLAVGQMQQLRREESLATLNLNASELKQVISGVEAAAFDSPDSWEKELLGRRISLGAAPGLILQGTDLLCGGTGNCQIFVFRRVNKDWVPLFASKDAPVVEGFSFGPGSTQGITDLHVISNSSAERSAGVTYKFDGKFYRPGRESPPSSKP
jgi:hypothetical protein